LGFDKNAQAPLSFSVARLVWLQTILIKPEKYIWDLLTGKAKKYHATLPSTYVPLVAKQFVKLSSVQQHTLRNFLTKWGDAIRHDLADLVQKIQFLQQLEQDQVFPRLQALLGNTTVTQEEREKEFYSMEHFSDVAKHAFHAQFANLTGMFSGWQSVMVDIYTICRMLSRGSQQLFFYGGDFHTSHIFMYFESLPECKTLFHTGQLLGENSSFVDMQLFPYACR
jgi:hypothetical protein